MDARTHDRRKSFHNVIDVLLLTPLVAYALIETVVYFYSNLILTLLCKLCVFAHHGIGKSIGFGKGSQQVLQKDSNCSQKDDIEPLRSQICKADARFFIKQNTKFRGRIKPGHAVSIHSENELCSPRKESEEMERFKTTQSEHTVSEDKMRKEDKNKTKKIPGPLVTQWVPERNTLLKPRNKAESRRDAQSIVNSSVLHQHLRRENEGENGKKVVWYQRKMFLVNSEKNWDFLVEKRKDFPFRQGMLDSHLRRPIKHIADFEAAFCKSCCKVKEICKGRLREYSCSNVPRKETRQQKPCQMIPCFYQTTKEECHLALVVATTDSYTPLQPISEDKITAKTTASLLNDAFKQAEFKPSQFQDSERSDIAVAPLHQTLNVEENIVNQKEMDEDKISDYQPPAFKSPGYDQKVRSRLLQQKNSILSISESTSNSMTRELLGGGYVLNKRCSRTTCGPAFTSFEVGGTKQAKLTTRIYQQEQQHQKGKLPGKSSSRESDWRNQQENQTRQKEITFSRIRQNRVKLHPKLAFLRMAREIDTTKRRESTL